LKVNRLLVGTLALVFIAGLQTAVFADQEIITSPISDEFQESKSVVHVMSDADDVIFDNGGVPNVVGGNLVIASPITIAEDFILNEDVLITDFHFVLDTFFGDTGDFTRNIEYFIFSDDGGQPGNILTSGNLVDLEFKQINDRFATVMYFLEEPFEAESGLTFWFGLSSEAGSFYAWSQTDAGEGSGACSSSLVPPTGGWGCGSVLHNWFLLTGHSPEIVGGELLPIDSTALLLAGAQTNAVWIMAALTVIGSIAFGALYITSKKH